MSDGLHVACTAIDPGVASPTGVVTIGGRWPDLEVMSHASVRPPRCDVRITDAPPMEQLAAIMVIAGTTADEAVAQYAESLRRPELRSDLVVEWYEDQGPVRARARGRYLVPMLIGMIAERCSTTASLPLVVTPQVASVVLRQYALLMRPGQKPQQVHGWETLRNEHERSAACHALWRCGEIARDDRWGR